MFYNGSTPDVKYNMFYVFIFFYFFVSIDYVIMQIEKSVLLQINYKLLNHKVVTETRKFVRLQI